jgi:hypothetical protein
VSPDEPRRREPECFFGTRPERGHRHASRAGFIYDRYDATNFKFVVIDVVADKVIAGHYTARERVGENDAVYSKALDAGVNYTLGMSLKGSTVSITLNGQVVLGYAYNASSVDGRFGLMAVTGPTQFDNVAVKTTDPAVALNHEPMVAADSPGATTHGATITSADLQPIVDEANSPAVADAGRGADRGLATVTFQVTDLPWLEIGDYRDGTIWTRRRCGGLWLVRRSLAGRRSRIRFAGRHAAGGFRSGGGPDGSADRGECTRWVT